MKRKKMFGIGATVLMILVTFIPAINGSQLESEINNEYNLESTGSGYDLEVTITKDPYLLYDEPNEIGGEYYSIYHVEYIVKNVGDERYSGKPLTEVVVQKNKDDPLSIIIFDDWYEDFTDGVLPKDKKGIDPGESKSLSHDIQVPTNDDAEKDIERYFADHTVTLRCNFGGGESMMGNNLVSKRIFNFWKEGDDFRPTTGQLLATTPYGYKTYATNINGEDYSVNICSKIFLLGNIKDADNILGFNFNWTKFIDWLKSLSVDDIRAKIDELIDLIWRQTPSYFDNHPLGWVNNLTYYIAKMSTALLCILLRVGAFFAATAKDWKVIMDWLDDVFGLFTQLLTTGTINTVKAVELLGDSRELVNAFGNITTAATLTWPQVLDDISVFKDEFYDYLDWRVTQPWLDEIWVHGRIPDLAEGETITITVGDSSNPLNTTIYTNDADDLPENNFYNFNIHIKTKDLPNPRAFHDCTITVTGTAHHTTLSSMRIFSRCFSGGTVFRMFPVWQIKSKSVDHEFNPMENIFERISRLFEGRPCLSLFNNLLLLFSSN